MSPPVTVTLYKFPDGLVTEVTVPVVPDTAKSAVPTLLTGSEKVISQET